MSLWLNIPALRLSPRHSHSRQPLAFRARGPTRCARADVITGRPGNNVTDNIFAKIGRNLHRQPDHPLCIIKSAIYQYMDQQGGVTYKTFDDLYPIVSTQVRPHKVEGI